MRIAKAAKMEASFPTRSSEANFRAVPLVGEFVLERRRRHVLLKHGFDNRQRLVGTFRRVELQVDPATLVLVQR